MIELRMLGEIRLHADSPDGTEIGALLGQPKRLALFAYLASPAPGTWHRRDMLLALFWPELDAAHARTSLRNALYVLRRNLGDAIVRSRGDEEVSIDPVVARTDVAQVWEALRDGRAEDALSKYCGELLPGLHPPDSDGFMRWLDAERARLKVAVSGAATARMTVLERAGDTCAALAIARRIAEINPDDETIVRRLMTLHDANGDRAGALLAFENYKARLAAEFEAEPAPETIALATRLRAPTTDPVGRTTPRVAALRVATTPPPAIVDAAPASTARPKSLTTWAIAVGVIAVAVALAWTALRPPKPLVIGTSTPLTADEGLQVEAAIASNGRLVAFAKGNSRLLQIYVQKIGGGPPWRLTSDSNATELMPRWSPDNDQLVFLAHNNAYVAPSIGGVPRIVARGALGEGNVRSASWSPRGDSIAIVRHDSLIVVPLTGSGQRVVAVAPKRQLHSCVWSSHVPWIACVAGNVLELEMGPLFGNEAPSAVVLFPAAGGKVVELTGNEFQNKNPAWSADGNFLWLLSSRGGISGEAYSVRISREGRAEAPYTRVGLTAESIDLTSNRVAYSVLVRRANIWAVPVPRDSILTLSASGTRITSGNQLIELVSASADKKWLVYDSNLYGNADIFRKPIAGGAAERLTDDPRPEYAAVLSPDGRELVWQRWVNGVRRLHSRRFDSDSVREISIGPGDQGVADWSPDGRSLTAWSHDTEEGAVFVMHRDASGAWQKPAWRLQGAKLPRWSQDGRTIAFILPNDGIATIPADSGPQRVIYSPRPGSDDPAVSQMVWTLDPSTIWFTGNTSHGRGGIWSVPASGGAPPRLRVDLDDPSGRSHGPGFTTDGSRFYFTLDERFSNVRWAELVRR